MRGERLLPILGLVGLATTLSTAAFSLDTRKKIFKRDQGECVDCGKRFADGWLMDASHYDHDHSSSEYDSADNGRVQCLDDHLKYHEQLGDNNAIFLLRKRIRETHGGHTRQWIEEHIK